MARHITKKEEAFAQAYVNNGFNATQAYLSAFDANYDCANTMGSQLLRKPAVKERIEELRDLEFEALAIDRRRIYSELAKIAFGEDSTKTEKLKALDMLAKAEQLYVQRVEVAQEVIKVEITD